MRTFNTTVSMIFLFKIERTYKALITKQIDMGKHDAFLVQELVLFRSVLLTNRIISVSGDIVSSVIISSIIVKQNQFLL